MIDLERVRLWLKAAPFWQLWLASVAVATLGMFGIVGGIVGLFATMDWLKAEYGFGVAISAYGLCAALVLGSVFAWMKRS